MNLFELAVVISATDKATRVINAVSGGLGRLEAAGERVADMGQKVSVQAALMQGAGDKMIGALVAINQPAEDMQEAINKIATVITPIDTVEQGLKRVEAAALDWADTHRDSAATFVDTTYNMIGAGLAEQAAIEGTRQAMLVARGTMGDTGATASLLATAYNNIGDKARPVAAVMKELGEVVTMTQGVFQFENLNQLTEGLKYAFPVMLQNKMAFEDTATVIGQLNNAGITGSQAGTSFAATMRVMGKASKDLGFEIAKTSDGGVDFIGTVRNIEQKFGTLSTMSDETKQKFGDAFGADGWMGLSLMVGKSDELAANLAKVKDNADASAKAAALMEQGSRAGREIMNNQLTHLSIVLGKHIGPTLEAIGPKVAAVVSNLIEFANANPTLVRTAMVIAMITAAILTVGSMALMYVGSMMMFGGHAMQAASLAGKAFMWMGKTAIPAILGAMKATAMWTASLLANPITWIVLGIAAAAFLIYKNWAPISGFFKNLWGGLQNMFKDGFVTGMVRLIQFPRQLRTMLAQWLWDAVSNAATAAFRAIPGIAAGAWAMLQSLGSGIVQAVSAGFGALVRIWDWLGQYSWSIGDMVNALPSIVMGALQIMTAAFLEFTPLGAMLRGFDSLTQWLWGFSLFDAGSNIINSVVRGMQAMANRPVEIMRGIAQKVRNLLPFSPAKDGPLRDIHKIKLVETIAGAIQPEPMTDAMRAVVGVAAATPMNDNALRVPFVPRLVTPQASTAGSDPARPMELHVHLHLGGSADAATVEQLRELLRKHGSEILAVVNEETRKAKRGDFAA